MSKILCCGDRNWDNLKVIYNTLKVFPKDTIIIEGEAKGADTLSKEAAQMLCLWVVKVEAKWELYGKGAGPKRNREMLDMIDKNTDMVYAFHNDIENSLGTKDCVSEARRRGIPVKIITENNGG